MNDSHPFSPPAKSDITPTCEHDFREGFNGLRNGRYEQDLICVRCHFVSTAWQRL